MNKQNHSKIAIISPSGNLYGSERVLLDFIKNTSHIYTVYLPDHSILLKEFKNLSLSHTLKIYNLQLLPLLYLHLFFLLVTQKLKCIYVNEGGHIRYLKLLAFCFPKRHFFIHIRIIEDTSPLRLGNLPNNLILIAVSDYIITHLKNKKQIIKIYDPFDHIPNIASSKPKPLNNTYTIGIIGRVTKTKGIEDAYKFFAFLDQIPDKKIIYKVHFFGVVESSTEVIEFVNNMKKLSSINVQFNGFRDNQSAIFESINCIIHFNPNESLGRVFFEAINFQVPFIGFNSGGIGEIAALLCLQKYVVTKNNTWTNDMFNILQNIIEFPESIETDLKMASNQMNIHFNVKHYVYELEKEIYR